MKKLALLTLTALLITQLPVKVSATQTNNLTSDKLKTYVGTSLLTGAGVNLTTKDMKEDSGNKLFNSLTESNSIKFKHNNTYKTYTDFVGESNIIPSDWNGVFKLEPGSSNKVIEFISTIPTIETEVLTPVEHGKVYDFDDTLLKFKYTDYRSTVRVEHLRADGTNYKGNWVSGNSSYSYIPIRFSNKDNQHKSWVNNQTWINYAVPLYIKFGEITLGATVDIVSNIPYTASTTSNATLDKLQAFVKEGKDINVGNNVDLVIGDSVVSSGDIVNGGFGVVNPVSLNTINISATVDPYLEVSLNTSDINLNVSALEDSSSEIIVDVKSNLNYKLDTTFTGLKTAENSFIADNLVNLSIGERVIELVKDTSHIIFDDYALGSNIHNLSFNLKSRNIIKADNYTGQLTFKASQL